MNSVATMLALSRNRRGTAMFLLLSWIANCDGELSVEEQNALLGIAAKVDKDLNVDDAIRLTERMNAADLTEVLNSVTDLDKEARPRFLTACIGVALADNYLKIGENHALRLVADALGLGETELSALFKDMTGQPLPLPGDPSKRSWWEGRSGEKQERRSNSGGPAGQSGKSPGVPQRLKDLGILGLDDSAGEEEIRDAYKRMARVHHPDRYSALGVEAAQAAEESFKRIRAAYERLVGA